MGRRSVSRGEVCRRTDQDTLILRQHETMPDVHLICLFATRQEIVTNSPTSCGRVGRDAL